RDRPTIEVLEEARQRIEHAEAEAAQSDVEPSTRTTEYRIRDYRVGDGLEVARRIYEAYGRSYPNPDLYVPERIDRLNREGRIHSIVCESDDGDVVGHYALERPDLGPIGEAGQAVIDHRHRGHGLMKPMRAAVEEAGRSLGLLGIWSQPTARHPVSQRMNLGFGSTPCALCLGTTPAGATLRGGVTGAIEDDANPARHSCFLYWHPLREEPPLVARVPEAVAAVLEPLYAARGRTVDFRTEVVDPPLGHETVASRFDSSRSVAWITVDRITVGALDAIQATMQAMENSVGAATVFIDLPIDDPGCVGLADHLLAEGIRLAGIGPRFRTIDGPQRAEDVLRLQANPAPVDLEGLVVEGDLGRALADAVLDSGRWSSSG
ncbi:MAG: GNAT family N-acetyltransferase, partial [Planctomycetota bacterium]|nr:GNAT family N-acetyltransferase [Planctomycetota bacterium]